MASANFVAATITPITPVTAVPTTAAHFAVWNGAQRGGKSLYIQSVASSTIVTSGAALGVQLYAHQSAGTPLGLGTFTAAKGPQPIGGGFVSSVAAVGSAVTIVNDSLWHPCTTNTNDASATAGVALGNYSSVAGLYVIPPGGLFSLAVVCNATGGAVTCNCYVTWTEA